MWWRFLSCGLVTIFLAVYGSSNALALVTEEIGNHPLSALNYPYWDGVAHVVNHSSRVYQRRGNAYEHCYFESNCDEVNELISRFEKLDLNEHTVVLKMGTQEIQAFQEGKKFKYNCSLLVNNGFNANLLPPKDGSVKTAIEKRPDPILTIFVSNTITRERLTISQTTTVVDERKKKE